MPAEITEAFKDGLNNESIHPEWTKVAIKPLLKPNKNKSLPNSYIPISIASVTLKLVESLAIAHMMRELDAMMGTFQFA